MNGDCLVKGWRDVDVMLENWALSWSEQRSKGDDSKAKKLESPNCIIGATNNITTPYIGSEVQQFDANCWDGVEGWSCLNVLPQPEYFMETDDCDQYGILM
jgi:hypothetical protein